MKGDSRRTKWGQGAEGGSNEIIQMPTAVKTQEEEEEEEEEARSLGRFLALIFLHLGEYVSIQN